MKKSILIALSAVALTTSCVDSLEEYNVDPKRAAVGTAPGVSFISNAERNLVRTINSANTNLNPFRYYVQYWAATDYPTESRYDINTRNINGLYWNALYRDVLRDLREAKTVINADPDLAPDVKANQLACAEVLEIYTWTTLVEVFGNIPYSQALDINTPLPAYDDQATIYNDLITRLDAVIPKFKVNAGLGDSSPSFDLINDGNVGLWVKFANSMKLRMALTIADVDDAKARTMVAAAAGNVLTSNADNIDLTYNGTFPNTNPLFEDLVRSGRRDFVGANTFINRLKGTEGPVQGIVDPRLDDYFNENQAGTYAGGIPGSTNNKNTNSEASDELREQTLPGVVISYAQVEFMLAEAAARGYAVTGSTESHYNAAIRASILEWASYAGPSNTPADVVNAATEATAYLANPGVAYATAPGADFREKIGYQKWIALYNQPTESFKEWRRLDSPKLTRSTRSLTEIPLRFPYPIAEQNVNGTNYNVASSAIGGDVVTTKLFWDKR
ncbi:SusD/RagB family nutrient-binding outer membrane lipoprotein [Hymenobacter sp. YC55]|uniref:SusD/RagB family nutrient-binding outer membrane lipoprotein n=1 Tax=Hymenobacter sp. YC55 TaxID=3034019 RepID=UPI0023F7F457|nr:SusD/RagB family nutrient-binding outer membrane lipoprotein [Hymenobacter sp. YC55]MDF7813491.1 SusD/RagB family nutrient-binding outer membrane lipoprotein [Hymenobacter sp. YC55]